MVISAAQQWEWGRQLWHSCTGGGVLKPEKCHTMDCFGFFP